MRIYHRHHVVPRHAGGTDDPSNMTCPLTIEEHAEHHRYRYEMLGEWQDRIAWLTLSGQISNQEAALLARVNGAKKRRGRRLSDEHRRKMSEANRGKPGTMLGRKLSDETRRKISEANRGRKLSDETRRKMSEATRGEKNPMYNKTPSDETRRKMSEANRGRKLSDEHCRKMSEARRGRVSPLRGRKLSDETRRKMSDARHAYWRMKNSIPPL